MMEGSMVHWTDHIPQAMQQHGASRKPVADALPAPADRKSQSSWPNAAEDAASRLTTPAVPPSSP
jgi:hypothetical protein